MLSGARRPGFRGKRVNAHSLWAAWTIAADSLGGRRQPVSVWHPAPESGTIKRYFAGSVSPGAQVLTAGEMSFAETHRYEEATAKRCHSPGTPLSW